jgi:hypothetical protein
MYNIEGEYNKHVHLVSGRMVSSEKPRQEIKDFSTSSEITLPETGTLTRHVFDIGLTGHQNKGRIY